MSRAPDHRLGFAEILPSWITRAGLRFMLITDILVISVLAYPYLAATGLAYSLGGVFYATSQGLLIGCLTTVAATRGGDPGRIALILREGLFFALAVAALLALVCQFGTGWLTLLGQDPEVIAEAAPLLAILGLGLPMHYLFVALGYTLEAQGARNRVAAWVGFGFCLNLLLSAALPSLLGLAPAQTLWCVVLTTLVVRLFILIGLVTTARETVDLKALRALPSWSRATGHGLRRVGLAAGASIGTESAAFAALSVFAGWLGPQSLAAYTMLVSLVSVIFSLALAVAVLTAARIAARSDLARARFREGLVTALALMGTLGLLAYLLRAPLVALTMTDADAALIALPLVGVVGFLMLGDGGQAVAQNALRAIGDAWPSTIIHLSSYMCLMVFGGWVLALPLERGVRGLLEATALASFTVLSLLTWRFWHLTVPNASAKEIP